MADFADYYREIYARGLGGETPAIPVAVAELEERAVAAMEPRIANYVGAGAGSEETIRANRAAFNRWQIVPRMLRDVSSRDLSTSVLGTAMPAPLLLAPIGVQQGVHPDGELATARAAAALGVPMIASSASHYSLEEIAAAGGPEAPRWFQLYWPNDPELARSFVERAERAGYGAIVLTVDTFIPGWKPRDLQQAWLPFLEGRGVGNYFQDPVFRAKLEKTPEEDPGMATGQFLAVQANPALSWEDLATLREMTSLPILVKGIQHPDDAREAVARGVDSIVVSNHGGRQVDGAIASLTALPPIAAAVGGELAVLFDSGVRSGSDVLKALALGADAVCLGRPYIWGLTLDGQAGVETVLKMVLAELDLTMALCGLTRPVEIGPGLLSPE
ncbi:MAG TPA: alpha-hydroxy-acid oxidizing protein [Solirubrobacterales bacterium]|nr:alpha-hydroxy-acid oxidizing protein [Solirubrobacterales bacterium]